MAKVKNDLEKQLEKLVKEIYEAVSKATSFADEHKLSFSLDITYGMGGTYDGDEENRYVPDYLSRDEHDGWYPSSQSC